MAPLLALMADGILDAPRQAMLDAHLEVCAACRMSLDDQIAVRAWLTKTPDAVVPEGFRDRVRARIAEDEGVFGVADFRLWTLRLAPLAALLAVVAWLGLGAKGSAVSGTAATITAAASTFSPSRAADWERTVSGNALLEAALFPPRAGAADVR
jgi:anti-sigma factor RsiW